MIPLRFIVLLLLLVATSESVLLAQVPQNVKVGKGFAIPYHEGTVLKAAFTGQDADPIPGGKVLVKKFLLKTFRDGDENKIDMFVEAPECIFDRSSYTASSPGPLKVYTATTNYFIEGEGFLWRQTRTNVYLFISNKVHTLIQRENTNANARVASLSTTNATRAAAPLEVASDRFEFESREEQGKNLRQAVYRGRVIAQDPDLKLTCALLRANLPSDGSKLNSLFAEEDVILTGADGSVATGERATYLAAGGKEIVELLGHPTWKDAQKRQAQAERFVFDRQERVVRAEKNARMRLPRQSSNSALGAFPTAAPGKISATNDIEITAAYITVKLPETNGPVQRIIAETNVVILSEGDGSRATADRAVYLAQVGSVELSGSPRWEVGGGEVTGTVLTIGLTNRIFSAVGQAFIRMPVNRLPRAAAPEASGTLASVASATNQFLEIHADDFRFQTNRALFDSHVVARWLEGRQALARLQCGLLELTFSESNHIERIVATRSVDLEQIPTTNKLTRILRKHFSAHELAVEIWPGTGFLRHIFAQGNVAGEQIEQAGPVRRIKTMAAEVVNARFTSVSNHLETLVAERNVKLRQDENWTTGSKAVYGMTPEGERLELTGEPVASLKQARDKQEDVRVMITGATVLSWDPKTGKVQSRGPFRIAPVNEAQPGKQVSPNSP